LAGLGGHDGEESTAFFSELPGRDVTRLLKNSDCRLLKKTSEATRAGFVIRVRGSCSSEHEKRARF
jgi:hypothetical protein